MNVGIVELCWCSLMNVGIVELDGQPYRDHPTNNITMVVLLLLQRHGCGKSASPTPRSLFGMGRRRAVVPGFIWLDWPVKKKWITKINNLFLFYLFYLHLVATKMMECCKSLHLCCLPWCAALSSSCRLRHLCCPIMLCCFLILLLCWLIVACRVVTLSYHLVLLWGSTLTNFCLLLL